jgi:hypothetical protein
VEDVVIEPLLEILVALLSKVRAALGKVLHFGIVVDIEMLCLEDVPVETGVLHLVAAEVKELGRNRRGTKEEKDHISEKPTAHANASDERRD